MIRNLSLKASKILASAAAILALGISPGWAADDDAPLPGSPTFTRDVAPILYKNCAECHRPGEIGPMSLLSYDEVRPWAKSIHKAVADRQMPPWHADPGYGPFLDERRLSDREIALITKWAESGAPQGDPKDLPQVPKLSTGEWTLGEPDYIIEFDSVTIPAEGPDQFKNLIHQTDFPEDKWVTAVEIEPSNRTVVHHVILWQVGEDGTPTPSGWLGAWAAGATERPFPEGTGRLLEKGSRIMADMHYHPSGKEGTDRTRVGLHFADKEVEKELVNLWVINTEFAIPAGDPNYEAHATHTFNQDSIILALTPHMHYRGKDFVYTLTRPDGKKEELLKVSRYDFNWQTTYQFKEPLEVPKGSRIDCVAHWDNSANNPANPDPNKTVRFGNESYDEMMIGFVDYVVKEGVRPKGGDDDLIRAKITELVNLYPGEVYELKVPNGPPGTPPQLNAIHLPREGEGGWYIKFGPIVGKAPLTQIKWDGDAFECLMSIPNQGEQTLKGKKDPTTGALLFTMSDGPGAGFPLRANPSKAE